MTEILKRLEIVKTGIEIDDTDIIELQMEKLHTLPIDTEVREILYKLKRNEYVAGLKDIKNYIGQFVGVIVYEGKEVQGLKFELKILEKQLQETTGIKNEYISVIEEFNSLYRLKLGDLISRILEIEKELLRKKIIEKEKTFKEKKEAYEQIKEEYKNLKIKHQAFEKKLEGMDEFDDAYDKVYEKFQALKRELNKKENELNTKRKEAKKAKKDFEEDPTTQEFHEANKDYDEFHNDYREELNRKRYDLNDEQKFELKRLYRKAVKLCHPDIVTDEHQIQAKSIIQKLNEAYLERNLLKVKEILLFLENGEGFGKMSDTIQDKDVLKLKIIELRKKLDETEEEIEKIKSDETFKTIQTIDDWEVYFAEMKVALQKKYENLLDENHDEKSQVIETAEPATGKKDDDDYWERPF
jgi:primosomal protein N'